MANGVCVVIGAGPGLGLGLARQFGQGGYSLVLLGRSSGPLNQLAETLRAEGLEARGLAVDVANFAALKAALGEVAQTQGLVEVLLYNAAGYGEGNALKQDPEGLVDAFRVSAGGFLAAVQAVVPAMLARGQGTILATGGGVVHQPSYEYLALGVGKTALRYAVLSLAPTLTAGGVRLAVVNVNGPIREGTHFAPDRIARQFWQLHQQAPGAFPAEVEYT